jgi:hypothetical protein
VTKPQKLHGIQKTMPMLLAIFLIRLAKEKKNE